MISSRWDASIPVRFLIADFDRYLVNYSASYIAHHIILIPDKPIPDKDTTNRTKFSNVSWSELNSNVYTNCVYYTSNLTVDFDALVTPLTNSGFIPPANIQVVIPTVWTATQQHVKTAGGGSAFPLTVFDVFGSLSGVTTVDFELMSTREMLPIFSLKPRCRTYAGADYWLLTMATENYAAFVRSDGHLDMREACKDGRISWWRPWCAFTVA